MNIALVLNVCMPLIAGGDSCEGYIVDVFPAVIPCTVEMDANRQALDDRFLSCESVDRDLLIDRTDSRTVRQIIADLNRELPYMGAGK